MSLLGTSADAILVVFIIDESINDGSTNHPPELNDFLDHEDHDDS